ARNRVAAPSGPAALDAARARGTHRSESGSSPAPSVISGSNHVPIAEATMNQLTSEAEQALHTLAQRYGVSFDAGQAVLFAVTSGGGTMAQFNVPELGGSGQWMQGGMTMVGDMFNYGLQARVSGLCSDLAQLLRSQPVFAPPPAPIGGMNSG